MSVNVRFEQEACRSDSFSATERQLELLMCSSVKVQLGKIRPVKSEYTILKSEASAIADMKLLDLLSSLNWTSFAKSKSEWKQPPMDHPVHRQYGGMHLGPTYCWQCSHALQFLSIALLQCFLSRRCQRSGSQSEPSL